MPEKFELTPKQQKEMASRASSDAKLIKKGAEYTSEGTLAVPSEIIESITKNEVLQKGTKQLLGTYIQQEFGKNNNIGELNTKLFWMSNLLIPSVAKSWDMDYSYSFPVDVIVDAVPENLKDEVNKNFEERAKKAEETGNYGSAAELFLFAGNNNKYIELYRKRAQQLEQEGEIFGGMGPVSGPHTGAIDY